MISDITDRLLPQIEDWQKRPLGEVYLIVFIDAVHFSVREIISTISGIIPIRVKQNTFPKVNENLRNNW